MYQQNKYIIWRNSLSTKDISNMLLLIVVLILYFIPIEFLYNNEWSFCIHKKLFKFDCPGCGMTRALNCFLHGKFRQALIYNIGVAPFVILIFLHFLSWFFQFNLIRILMNITNVLLVIFLFAPYFIKLIQHFL